MKAFPYPAEFTRNIEGIFAERGRLWLQELPALVERLSLEWGFTSPSMLSNLTYSFVAEVEIGGAAAILKLAPSGGRTKNEIAWYECNRASTAAVFRSDPARGALLMEKLSPGHTLKRLVIEGRDDEATIALAQAIAGLQPVSHPRHSFKHVSDLASDLEALDGEVEHFLLERARAIIREHTADRSHDLPLHGDIHHDNILASGNGWKVIDPHGYCGPRGFEVGCMLRNPYDCFPRTASLAKIIRRRTEILAAETPFPREEILAWGFAYTMLAVSWSASDHGEVPEEPVEIARILLAL